MRRHGMMGIVAAMAMTSLAAVPAVETAPRPRRKPEAPDRDDQPGEAPTPETPDTPPTPAEAREPYEMPEGMPQRLSISYGSPHFHDGVSSLIGVEIDGVIVSNCYEYDIPGGWYRVKTNGRASDKLFSKDIRPFWRAKPSRQVLRRLKRA